MSGAPIRNFSIIAHIDHGKSTLADRLLERTGALEAREMEHQVLDSMDLERERGITIKAHAVRLEYDAADGQRYELNLIDTPGHVDFTYEVSRSLAACEGALLVVDASQGMEAQTIANAYLAIDHDLHLIPVLNKIDLPAAEPERVREQLVRFLGSKPEEVLAISAKDGTGIEAVLEAVVAWIPPPKGDPEAPLKAMIFDSWYDTYRGVVMLVRVFDGELRPGQKVTLMSLGRIHEVQELGVFTPKPKPADRLGPGSVGFVIAGLKEIRDCKIGDTLTEAQRPTASPCPGFREVKPMVFAGLYPIQDTDVTDLRDALEKLRLNDSSFMFEPEASAALGFGFRCGFLGLLHLEIITERLEREFGLSLINTAPGVRYRVRTRAGEEFEIENPSRLPAPTEIDAIFEPMIDAMVLTHDSFVGPILKLCEDRRGTQQALEYLATDRVLLRYRMPLAEVVMDFYDRLKSVSKGYASLDYDLAGMEEADLVKLDILVNGEPVDALSSIVHRERAYTRGRGLCEKLRELIPRQLFEVRIQAAIGGKIIARETVKPLRKNVLAKCYGGDITRKRKLLEKQKEGKKRMKRVGSVDIPQEAFLAVLKTESD
ncbi:MAG TPA: translation elongation factor 4 [Acidobacteriota bacterium]